MFNYLVQDAKYVEDYKIWLSFSDGSCGEVDLFQKINSRKGVFIPVRDKNYFKNFAIVGSTVAWENGADLAPESLYELLKQQNKEK